MVLWIHLLAAILWIGPALGGYFFLVHAHRSRDPGRIVWVERALERLLIFEHLCLIGLLATGAVLLWETNWVLLITPWMQLKLALVGLVILFEGFDIWISHWVFPKVLKHPNPTQDPRWKKALSLRRKVLLPGFLAMALIIPAILYLAVVKEV